MIIGFKQTPVSATGAQGRDVDPRFEGKYPHSKQPTATPTNMSSTYSQNSDCDEIFCPNSPGGTSVIT